MRLTDLKNQTGYAIHIILSRSLIFTKKGFEIFARPCLQHMIAFKSSNRTNLDKAGFSSFFKHFCSLKAT